MWEAAARMFEPTRHDWATPGDLARAIEPSTVQTPALDLIDEYYVKVESGEIDRLIINMPPQEGKSTRVTTIGPSWFLNRNRNRRIAIVSYAQDLADEFGRNIRSHIASNNGEDETLDLGLRVARDNGAARRWQLEGSRGGVRAEGIRGGLTGRPVGALFIDDPISNLEQANSKTYRDRAWGFWQSVGMTRLAPGAPVILVLTRWHADDLAGLLAAEDAHRWTVLNIPAAAEENDPLGRKPREWLESSRKRTAKQWEQIKVAVGLKVWQSLYGTYWTARALSTSSSSAPQGAGSRPSTSRHCSRGPWRSPSTRSSSTRTTTKTPSSRTPPPRSAPPAWPRRRKSSQTRSRATYDTFIAAASKIPSRSCKTSWTPTTFSATSLTSSMWYLGAPRSTSWPRTGASATSRRLKRSCGKSWWNP